MQPRDFESFAPLQIDTTLWLRAVALEDAPALASFVDDNRAHLSVFLADLTDEICDATSAARHLADVLNLRLHKILLEMHVWDGARLCGAVRLRDVDWQHRHANIGYLLGARDQGSGVINRALTAFLAWVFEELQLHRVELRCDPRNAPSIAVAKRLGFTYEGTARGVECRGNDFEDVMIFARLRTD
ncbi:MAG: GNAT family N-acetyltransferase [Kofleriaceae bacterium]|nr:GNAT family N-acetyltransferase [Kofleriaceae bacterium]